MARCCHAAIGSSTPFIMAIRFPEEIPMQSKPRVFAAVLAVLALACGAARAEWPDHPLRWVVPFSPGGANDLIARAAAEAVSRRLAQPVIIENKPGAGAMIGADYVAKAKPDG